MFSARRRVLLSEHVSPTIRIRYDDTIWPNTKRLFGPLFGTEANTNRIFGTPVPLSIQLYCIMSKDNFTREEQREQEQEEEQYEEQEQ